RDSLMRDVSNVYSYARMRRDEDTTNQKYQGFTARAQSLASDASSAASFIEPEVQQLDESEIDEMLDETDGLEVYNHYLDDLLRLKPHTRSAEVEELLADLGEVIAGGEVYEMLSNADMDFPTVENPEGENVEITLANFTKLQRNPDREFRKTVYEEFYDRWAEVRNAVGTAYSKSVKADVKLARARNYDTAREASLSSPNIPVEVYDNLLDTVRDNLGTLHRHAALKKKIAGGDELRMWDLYIPLTETESPEVEYEDAKSYIVEAVEPLGDDYQTRVAEGLDS
ncbi:MAG: M3 family metallopeptidase, partial [Halobacteria archaeon]|nr:M3 family metallopeptidase [Halobacteria archaeon]